MLRRFPVIVASLGLLAAAACSSSGGGGGTTLSITSPADGATVSAPFTVTVASSVPLGPPSSGNHHVHIWFDGDDSHYTLGYSNHVRITDVSSGKHQMTVSLRNPNHSAAGVDKTITITVSSGAGQSQTPTSGTSSSSGYTY
jgi:hypothetical protein